MPCSLKSPKIFFCYYYYVKNDFFAVYGKIFLPPRHKDTKDYAKKFFLSAFVSL